MREHEEFADHDFRRNGEKLIRGLDYRKKHGLIEVDTQSIREAETVMKS